MLQKNKLTIMKRNIKYISDKKKRIRMTTKLILAGLFYVLTFPAFAQIDGNLYEKKNKDLFHQKVEELGAFLTKGKMEIDDDRLSITFIENDQPYRIDYLYLETLDSNQIYYSEEEKVVIAKCKSSDELDGKLKKFQDGCIERHILKNEIIRAYFRIGFDINGSKEDFIKKLKELVVASQAEKTH